MKTPANVGSTTDIVQGRLPRIRVGIRFLLPGLEVDDVTGFVTLTEEDCSKIYHLMV